MSGRFVLEVHPDDAQLWKAMTGRDETRPDDMPPIKTRESLDYMLDSAKRNGVRVTSWRDLEAI